MLLYYLFWMFMGFTLHFYIIFGTNLLTGGPAHIAVYLPISVFWRKGISKGVQTEWNLRESYFWNGSNPADLESMSGKQRGSHKAGRRALGGRPHPRGQLPYLLTWGPSPSGVFPSKNNFSSWFRSVSTPFDIPFLQNTEIGRKQQFWAGPPVNRLVPKII